MTGFSAPLLRQPALTEEQESTHARVKGFWGQLWLMKLLFRQWWHENEPSELIFRRWTSKFIHMGILNIQQAYEFIFWWNAVGSFPQRLFQMGLWWKAVGSFPRRLILFVRRLVLIEVIPNWSLDCWIFRTEEIKTRRSGCLSSNDCYENDGSNSSRDGSRRDLCSRACFLLL